MRITKLLAGIWLLLMCVAPHRYASAQSPGSTSGTGAQAGSGTLGPPSAAQIGAAKKQGKVKVRLVTARGSIVLELDGSAAPIAVANFLNLVKSGFYNGMPFHRVEPGFVIQAGDPTLVNRPPVGYTIPDERSPIKHARGTIAMARVYRARKMVPNSASTQFYITLADTPHLDQIGFTAFGRVVQGMDVVGKITRGDKIREAAIASRRASSG